MPQLRNNYYVFSQVETCRKTARAWQMRLVIAALFLLAPPVFAQEAKIVGESAQREAKIELTFRNPEPQFAKLVLTSEEVGQDEEQRKTVAYSVQVKGLPKSKSYLLMSWDVGTDAPIVAMRDVHIDDNGKLRCGSPKSCPGMESGTEVRLRVTAMLGQPRRFVLTENDKKPLALGEAVPFPAIGKDNQCTLEAVLLRPNAAIVLLMGEGFVPGESISTVSGSYGENVAGVEKANPNGRVVRGALPFVKGHNDGKTTVTFQGANCHPSTTFNWGSYQEERAGSKIQALP